MTVPMKPMARYGMPGSFFAEDDAKELPERSPEAAVAAAPRAAFVRLADDATIERVAVQRRAVGDWETVDSVNRHG